MPPNQCAALIDGEPCERAFDTSAGVVEITEILDSEPPGVDHESIVVVVAESRRADRDRGKSAMSVAT